MRARERTRKRLRSSVETINLERGETRVLSVGTDALEHVLGDPLSRKLLRCLLALLVDADGRIH